MVLVTAKTSYIFGKQTGDHMKFHFWHPSKNSLRINFSLIMSAFILSLLVICTLIIFTTNATRKAFTEQSTVLERYHLEFDVNNAVHELLYRSADLSNSLSDEALDAFLNAQTTLNKFSTQLDEPEFTQAIQTTSQVIQEISQEIVDGSLIALDHYLLDERRAGDAVMNEVRNKSHALQAKVMDYQAETLLAVEAIQRETVALNDAVRRGTSILVALSVIMFIALFTILLRLTIRPIQALVDILKTAARSSNANQSYRAEITHGGEIGEAMKAVNVLLDATENALSAAHAQTEISAQSESRWKAILNLTPDPILLLDQQTFSIIDTNPATLELLNIDQTETSKFSAYDFHPHEKAELREFLYEIVQNGHARADHLSCQLPGRNVPVSVVGVDIPYEDGRATLLYIRDMSEIIAQQRKLELAQQQAEQADKAKSAFLATMSHEIRTPLNGMMGIAQALQSSALTPIDADMVETIVESGDMLMTILNDVLDISKINAEQMTLSKVPSDLEHLIQQTCKLFERLAEDKGLEIAMVISPDLPSSLLLDPVRVRQCLSNLVSNAVKFTKQGKVTIEAFIGSNADNTQTITVRVTDTGIGMSNDTRQQVFCAFVQADNTISREFGGTGLGLSISHKLAQLMGGDITVESQIGTGSRFTFSFIAQRAEPKISIEKPATSPPKSSLGDCRILLVDDSPTNRKVIRTLLAPTGVHIVEAENGQEALNLLHQQVFDVVLLDMHMPVLNGPDTIASIRISGEKWHDIAVIAVTADATIGENGKYQEMQMDGYIGKPVDQRILLGNIFKSLSKPRGIQPALTKKAS